MAISEHEVSAISQVLGLRGSVSIKKQDPIKEPALLTSQSSSRFSFISNLFGTTTPSTKIDLEGAYNYASVLFLDLVYNKLRIQEQKKLSESDASKIQTDLNCFFLDVSRGKNNIDQEKFVERINSLKNGEVQTIATGWEGHDIGVSFVREGNQLHLIYINKGDTYFDSWSPIDIFPESWLPQSLIRFKRRIVQAYTFNTTEIKEEQLLKIISRVHNTCTGQAASKTFNPFARLYDAIFGGGPVRDSFHELFTSDDFIAARNEKLSQSIIKSEQKVGNCGHANRNIFWHFTLAGEAMRNAPAESPLGFVAAYEKTKDKYKEMRQRERWDAFAFLLSKKDDFVSGWHDMAFQAFEKLLHKEQKSEQKRFEKGVAIPYHFSFGSFVNWLGGCKDNKTAVANLAELVKLRLEYLEERDGALNFAKLENALNEYRKSLKDASFLTRWYYNWCINSTTANLVNLSTLQTLRNASEALDKIMKPQQEDLTSIGDVPAGFDIDDEDAEATPQIASALVHGDEHAVDNDPVSYVKDLFVTSYNYKISSAEKPAHEEPLQNSPKEASNKVVPSKLVR